MNKTHYGVALIAAVALLGSACGGGDGGDDAGGDGGGADHTVATTEYRFDPSSLSIPADTTVTIEVDNSKGVIEHDFTLEEDGGVTIHADASKTATGTVSLPAGTYTFYCSVPGHREQGMEGELTVG